MEIEELHKRFRDIIEKYGLDDEKSAEDISQFLTNSTREGVNAKDFASLFGMTEDEAKLFLSFIDKGLRFKEDSLDKNENNAT